MDAFYTLKIMRALREIIKIILWPVLILIWLVEDLCRRWSNNEEWRVNSIQASLLFLLQSLIGFYIIIYTKITWIRLCAIYTLTSVEVLSLILSFIVGFGKSTTVHCLIQKIGERKPESLLNTRTADGVFRVCAAYIYNIFYFGSLYVFIYSADASSFALGTEDGGTPNFDMYYYSASVLTLFANPLKAVSVAAKLVTLAEVFVGFGFIIFVFSSVISFHVAQASEHPTSKL